jgi:hypothetical protein
MRDLWLQILELLTVHGVIDNLEFGAPVGLSETYFKGSYLSKQPL